VASEYLYLNQFGDVNGWDLQHARFEWHEACLPKLRRRQVTKVAHYYLSVDALTRPMQVREESPPYGEEV
jgi:hypothetical protein